MDHVSQFREFRHVDSKDAGHIGEGDITNFILQGRARQVLKVPFITSDGFADG